MKRLAIILGFAALLALPALALASTPVNGAEKRAVIGSVAKADHFNPDPSPRQVAECWSVRSFRGFASANFTPKGSQIKQCSPTTDYKGVRGQWQPDSMILKLTPHGWVKKLEYDDLPTCGDAVQHGVPPVVFIVLAHGQCTGFGEPPQRGQS